MPYTVSDFVIDSLKNQGLEHFYILPGGGCMYLVDALARRPTLTVTTLLHEQSVGVAAEAHAQYTNNFGVALVTTGPGATNAVTPCAAAWTDSTPVIFISGQVKTSDSRSKFGVRQMGFQEIPISEIVKPITKSVVSVKNAEEIPEALLELIMIARTGRPGPVWLDIPLDIQKMELNEIPLNTIEISQSFDQVSDQIIDSMVEKWRKAERPILLAGNGIRISCALEEFKQLISLTNTPALLTWKAMDFLGELDPLNAGRPGAIAQRWSNFAQQTSDFIICIGARMDQGQVAYRLDEFAPHAHKYIVDIDQAELKKFSSLDAITIQADAKVFMRQVLERIHTTGMHPETSAWVKRISNWKMKYPLTQAKHLSPRSGVNLYVFMDCLSSALNSTDILVPGSSGACSELTMQAFKVKDGQRVLNSEGLGPMGFGIPASIGVCIASGRQRVISIDGDGGILMNIQDLASISNLNLPIKTFILNNNGYGSIKSSQDAYFDGRRLGTDPSNGLALPEFEKIAYGFGIKYFRIASNREIEDVLALVLSEEGPVLIEILVDPDQITEPRTTTRVSAEGNFETSPMQYLAPPIDEDELRQIFSF